MNQALMKFTLFAFLTVGGLLCVAQAADKTELKDQKEKISYSFGMNIGNNFKAQEIDVDYDALIQGIKDTMGGKSPLLNDQEARQVINAYRTEHTAKLQAKRKELGERNKVEGEKFLAENKEKPGVLTLPSGLQYKVITQGSGPIPKTNDTVTVNHRGTLVDGTEFDSSFKRGQPYTTSLAFVIKGWTEALSKMNVGSKWQLFVPSQLAYGEAGQGRTIGPNAALIFEVELLSIK